MKSNRFIELDISKCIAATLVILGHNHIVLGEKGWLFRWIYSFHMPLFLFVSSLLTITDHRHKTLLFWRKCRLILWPYALINLSLLASDLFRPAAVHASTAMTLIYATGEGQRWTPLWYLPYYFVLSIVMHFTIWRVGGTRRRLYQRLMLGTIVFLASLATCFAFNNQLICTSTFRTAINKCNSAGFPLSVDLLWIGLVMLFAAAVYRKCENALPFSVLGNSLIGVLCVMLSVLSTYYFFNVFDMNSRIFGTFSLTLINALLGTAGVVFCARSMAAWLRSFPSKGYFNNFVESVSSASLIVLIFHFPIQNTAWKFFELRSSPLLASLLSFGITVLALILINKIIRRCVFVNSLWYFRVPPAQ